jgi:hypothetical protein
VIETERRLRARARSEVQYAIKSGKLPPADSLPCHDCGSTAGEYDHYAGYEREHWLTVQAVCKGCHVKRTTKGDAWKDRSPSKGRPSAAGGRVKFTTTLPAEIVEALREIGGGNASQAIIMLVKAAMAIRVTDKTIRQVNQT